MKNIIKITVLIFSITCLLTGCQSKETDRADTHEDETHIHFIELVDTQTDLEAFAKFDHPIVNEKAHMDLFLTDLNTGKNAADKPVNLRFIRENGEIEEKEIPHQDKNGIYFTEITFGNPGNVDFQLIYPADDERVTFNLGKFRIWESKETMEKELHEEHEPGEENHDEENHEEHEEEVSEVDIIEFSKVEQWYIGLKTEKPKNTELSAAISSIAKILPLPEHKAKISSPYGGKIIFPPGFTLHRVGDRINKGDILAVIQPIAFQPDQVNSFNLTMEEQKAKLLMEQAYTEYTRAKKLYEENIIPQKRLIAAETEYQIAKRNYENIKSLKTVYFHEESQEDATNDKMDYYYIKAPIDGILTSSHIFRGELIEPHEELCQIIDPGKVWIELQVHEKDVLKIPSHKTATLYIVAGGQQLKIPPENTQLVSRGIALNEETRTLPIIYELKNPDYRLKVGMMVDVFLSYPTKKRGMVIPESALIEMEGVPYVFVKMAEEKFVRKPVEIAKLGTDVVQILKGIDYDDKVVVSGVYNLKLASSRTAIPAAHEGHQH